MSQTSKKEPSVDLHKELLTGVSLEDRKAELIESRDLAISLGMSEELANATYDIDRL
mgnify:CR=1 FL=1|jgi:hypothetical protein